jgi:RNA polymerase sigma-70 factor (sigma-E family)
MVRAVPPWPGGESGKEPGPPGVEEDVMAIERARDEGGTPTVETAAIGLPPAWPDLLVQLYREDYGAMVRFAHLLTGSNAIAEEMVQDAFVQLRRGWSRAANPPAYLRVTVANNCRSWHRRQALEIRRRPNPTGPAELEADELWDAIQTLPFRQRAAIVLRFYEDMSEAEAAEVLGCRPGTVGSAVHRGLARLREVIER